MKTPRPKSYWLFWLSLATIVAQKVEWDATNFPNPTAGDMARCNMATTANICDPDGILTKEQRYRLNHELHQLESRTRQPHAPDFCQKKGITAAMGVCKHVRGGSEEAIREMANSMLKKWTLDDQCQKSLVIVVAVEDRKFWVARDPRVPVYGDEFTQIFANQRSLFQQGDYAKGLGNILRETWEKAISKQGPSGSGDAGRRPRPPPPPRPDDGRKETSMIPPIPSWIWIALVAVVIPLLCCCCICYCCCCRGKGGGQQVPSDAEGGATGGMGGGRGQGMGGGRSRGGGFANVLSALGGGAALGNLASNFMHRRGGGGGMFGGGRGGFRPGRSAGGGVPMGPYHPRKDEDVGGLYPNIPKDDRGGGGGW
ncbi:hypothetical protein AB6A40_003268 [Gnathostoma spinigerum]|uniref:TPM domain-containing protein n=1 Tax=Gnathostoma spinigerum TaxID=75299 RepID=A0ABD6E941_9BILA